MDSCNRDQAPAAVEVAGDATWLRQVRCTGGTVSRGNKQRVRDPQELREATGDEQDRREPTWGDEAVLAAQCLRLFGL